MSTPEGLVKKKLKKLLEEWGVYYFPPATGGYGRSGVPDFVCCVCEKFKAIETKKIGGKLTTLQEKERDKILAAGGGYLVYDGTIPDHAVYKFLFGCRQNYGG